LKCWRFLEEARCCGPCRLVLRGSDRERLSRLMSAILRHAAPSYGVRLSSDGWARLDDLVEAAKRRHPWASREHVEAVAACDPKGRFEVARGLVRARYGHSLPVSPSYVEDREVNTLFHGTTLDRVPSILREGLRPMKRRMVHLSASLEEALTNASRWRGREPAVVVVDAAKLRSMGFKVYKASHAVYLAERVPPSCIVKVVGKGLSQPSPAS